MKLVHSNLSRLDKDTMQNGSLNHYFVMTVDVDSWSSLLRFYSVPHNAAKVNRLVNVNEGISKLLDLFEKQGIKATFFVPGEVAKNNAWSMQEIQQDGHEVACHGLSHEKNECLLDKESQRNTILEATRIIQEKIGSQPKGFRAPCLRANQTTFETLDECGYVYDSSVIPTYVPGYYGQLNAPAKPYHPSQGIIRKEGSLKLLEMPVSINPLVPLPLSAAWMRNLGLKWVKFGIKINFLLGNPVVFYMHPRDVVALPRAKGVPWHLYRNAGLPSIRMLDEIINYARKLCARFVCAIDLARILNNCQRKPAGVGDVSNHNEAYYHHRNLR